MWGVLGPVFAIIFVICIINVIQNKKPESLPEFLKNWDFLPEFMRSLRPYDRVFTALPCCKSCRIAQENSEDLEEVVHSSRSSTNSRSTIVENGNDNPIHVSDNTRF